MFESELIDFSHYNLMPSTPPHFIHRVESYEQRQLRFTDVSSCSNRSIFVNHRHLPNMLEKTRKLAMNIIKSVLGDQ